MPYFPGKKVLGDLVNDLLVLKVLLTSVLVADKSAGYPKLELDGPVLFHAVEDSEAGDVLVVREVLADEREHQSAPKRVDGGAVQAREFAPNVASLLVCGILPFRLNSPLEHKETVDYLFFLLFALENDHFLGGVVLQVVEKPGGVAVGGVLPEKGELFEAVEGVDDEQIFVVVAGGLHVGFLVLLPNAPGISEFTLGTRILGWIVVHCKLSGVSSPEF